jgi:hypothetical protein
MFVERFGGDLAHISRCFRQLADWEYIEIVEERPGRRPGVAIEHVYEAVRCAHFDIAAWEAISVSDRQGVSYSILSSYFHRVREAVEAGTFDQDLDRHFSWDVVVVDRIGWKELNTKLEAVLNSLSSLELEAADRLSKAGIEAIPTVVGLAAFRSPQSPSEMLQTTRGNLGPTDPGDSGFSFGIGTKLAMALSSVWRCRILMEASIRPISASQFVEELGGSMSNIARCFRELAEWGYLEMVDERKGGRNGGGVERVYRSVCRAYFDAATWEILPKPLREEISQSFFDSYLDYVTEAISAGTFDAELDRHLSWKPLRLDPIAWKSIGEVLDSILAWVPQLEAESIERTSNLKELIPTVMNLTCFRAAQLEPNSE